MKVSISGQHISVGESLNDHVTARINELVERYISKAINANVRFHKESYQFHCDIVVNGGSGRNINLKSQGKSDEAYSAFEDAAGKLERQLKKYKSKINKHAASGIKLAEVSTPATKYVISPQEEAFEDDFEASGHSPVIIAEKPTDIETISVGDAVMKMDLENLPALMFKNVKNDRINIVYYRKDGNISWVDLK
ncbi:MAG: ribosome-associated translation inhibitor RaiA [Rickettsiaceae bacterium]|nr:ribosome-associated translation inhibitor RaiA [Rickettsiaceae bacterium]